MSLRNANLEYDTCSDAICTYSLFLMGSVLMTKLSYNLVTRCSRAVVSHKVVISFVTRT